MQMAVSSMIASGISQLYVDYHPSQLTGQQLLKQGDMIFIKKTGVLITKEYGPLSVWPGLEEGLVVSEGLTVDGELVLVYTPQSYMEPPEVSLEEIMGQHGVDGSGRWREIRSMAQQ